MRATWGPLYGDGMGTNQSACFFVLPSSTRCRHLFSFGGEGEYRNAQAGLFLFPCRDIAKLEARRSGGLEAVKVTLSGPSDPSDPQAALRR